MEFHCLKSIAVLATTDSDMKIAEQEKIFKDH